MCALYSVLVEIFLYVSGCFCSSSSKYSRSSVLSVLTANITCKIWTDVMPAGGTSPVAALFPRDNASTSLGHISSLLTADTTCKKQNTCRAHNKGHVSGHLSGHQATCPAAQERLWQEVIQKTTICIINMIPRRPDLREMTPSVAGAVACRLFLSSRRFENWLCHSASAAVW